MTTITRAHGKGFFFAGFRIGAAVRTDLLPEDAGVDDAGDDDVVAMVIISINSRRDEKPMKTLRQPAIVGTYPH